MGFYARWMDRWETKLASRDTNRVIRDFDWGLEWLSEEAANGNAAERMLAVCDESLRESDAFFAHEPRSDYCLIDGHLTFTSAVRTPYPENNRVHADYFPARRHRDRAVVVLPQWNAGAGGHLGLCRLLNHFGISALRMSLAFHDRRMPAETQRADYHVSSNVGRTIQATRQSVIDARSCLDWLAGRGYRRLGILGTSLGSCVAFIVAAHDGRVRAAAFNHVSTYFGDVVWTGLSTRHVRAGMERVISQDDLRRLWAVISPASYLERMQARRIPILLVWGRHDTTFLPVYSRRVIEGLERLGVPRRVLSLPCGHYTTGQFPFNILDGMALSSFLWSKL